MGDSESLVLFELLFDEDDDAPLFRVSVMVRLAADELEDDDADDDEYDVVDDEAADDDEGCKEMLRFGCNEIVREGVIVVDSDADEDDADDDVTGSCDA
jgi:hypothetical protein